MLIPINLAGVQAATGFDYPPGRYIFEITGAKFATNSDGQGQRLVVNNKIIMGPGQSTQFAERPLANSYQMTEKGAPFLKRLLVSIGFDEAYISSGQVDTDHMIGRQYGASVVRQNNYTNIQNEFPTSEWNDGAAPTAAAAAPAPQPALLQPTAAAPAVVPAPAPAPVPAPAPGGFVAPPPPPAKVGG